MAQLNRQRTANALLVRSVMIKLALGALVTVSLTPAMTSLEFGTPGIRPRSS